MHNFLSIDPKTEYATAWRLGVEEARSAARLPSCLKILLPLFLVVLILQSIAASMRAYVDPDGITYLCTADYLLEGNLKKGFSSFGVNTFIYLLVFFKRVGLDPFSTGVWWNVAMSSLAVLPLFGWVRRMFDVRIAIVASLLYAFQPIVLSNGSALMRDPMFWLFFNLTLYGAWRGMTEVRLRWFVLAGVGLTLAVHTRSEAWFLMIPILLWTLGRLRFAQGHRVALCFGTATLLAIVPGSIAAMNWTVLKSYPQWGIFRPSHARQLSTLYKDIKAKVAQPSDTPPKPKTSSMKAKPEAPPSFVGPGFKRAVVRLVKGYSYLYGIYLLLGIITWRARRRFAIHAMTLMFIPIFALVWYKSCNNDVSPRYFLPIVFVTLPVIALGLLWIAQKLTVRSRAPFFWLSILIVATLVFNCFDTAWGMSLLEQKECELGKWILKNHGPGQQLCCINRKSRIVGWYADTKAHRQLWFPVWGPNNRPSRPHSLDALFKKTKPHFVLCWENPRKPKKIPGVFETLKKNHYYGYELIETGVFENSEPRVLVLRRKTPP